MTGIHTAEMGQYIKFLTQQYPIYQTQPWYTPY